MTRQKPGFTIEGMSELRAMLRDYGPKETKNIMRAAVQNLAEDVRDRLKDRIKKRTRKAMKSIKAVRRRGTPTMIESEVRGGADAPYLIILEYGTRHTRAQPFITPIVEETRPKLEAYFRENFGKELERAMALRAKTGKGRR